MLQRPIPSSGEMLPVIGMGTWKTFDVNPSGPESKNLLQVLDIFKGEGGKLIDTSPMYGNAENAIGTLTTGAGIANSFFYATKIWTNGKDAGIHQLESSMKKMRLILLDLVEIHNLLDWHTHIKTLRKWKDEGRVRYIGITHYTVSSHEELEKIIRSEKIDFVQFNYSIGVRNAEIGLLPAAMERGIAVIINEPLEKGHLFNRVMGKSLPPWATENGMSNWSQFFLKYILSHPGVTCIIPATSNPDNMLANMSAGSCELPDERMKRKMVQWLENI